MPEKGCTKMKRIYGETSLYYSRTAIAEPHTITSGAAQSGSQKVNHFCESWCLHTSLEVPQSKSDEFSDLPLSLHALERCEDKNLRKKWRTFWEPDCFTS